MAKEVEWTQTAVRDRFRIYRFWVKRNQSETFSIKLEELFREASKVISEFPEIGTQTDFPELRVKVVRDYKVFYLNQTNKVTIVKVWDARQNPQDLDLQTLLE